MTIQSQNTRVDYTGNGATTNFPVPFYWLQDTDLLVIRTDNFYVPPTVATLALGTDYVVTGSGNQSGGSITTTVAPTATQKLAILRNVPFTQLTHYVPNDPFPAASHEQALDKLTMETQQLNEGLSRSITLPPNATGLSTNLPLPAANNLIGWNATADALQNVSPTTIATSVTYGSAVADKFSGDGSTVNFNLSANPGSINNLDVSIGGVTQRPGIDYTWVAGTVLTFTAAPPSGTNNVLARYTQALPIGTATAGNVAFDNTTLDQQLLYRVNRVVDSISALRGLSKSTYTRAFVTGYYAAGDGGGGAYWYDPSDTTGADNGGTVIVAADGGRWKLEYTNTVSVKQFGAKGDKTTDDTAAIQSAINWVKANSQVTTLSIIGDFKVTQIVFDTFSGHSVYSAGVLIGATSGSYDAVMVVKNSSDVTFTGRLVVSAAYNTGYSAAIAVYTDNGTQASTLQFHGVSCSSAALGWRFGRTTEPDALISEITVEGGYLYGCPSAVECIGTQTVVSFVGMQLITGTNGGSGAWLTLPRVCVKSIGAYVTLTSGEALMTDVTNGVLIQMEPIVSATFGNQYGHVIVMGTQIESASQYANITNPSSIGSIIPSRGLLMIKGSGGYHSQNSFAMVNVAPDFPGRIVIKECDFYAGVARTLPNIYCPTQTCDVWVDDTSFGYNFSTGLSAVSGCILHFDRRVIFSASNANGQAFSAGVATVVKYSTVATGADVTRFNSSYNSSTGQFTVPTGGLKSVSVNACLRTNQTAQALDIAVYVNGSLAALTNTSLGGGSGVARIVAELGDLAAGQIITVVATQSGAASTANGGAFETFTIVARN